MGLYFLYCVASWIKLSKAQSCLLGVSLSLCVSGLFLLVPHGIFISLNIFVMNLCSSLCFLSPSLSFLPLSFPILFSPLLFFFLSKFTKCFLIHFLGNLPSVFIVLLLLKAPCLVSLRPRPWLCTSSISECYFHWKKTTWNSDESWHLIFAVQRESLKKEIYSLKSPFYPSSPVTSIALDIPLPIAHHLSF